MVGWTIGLRSAAALMCFVLGVGAVCPAGLASERLSGAGNLERGTTLAEVVPREPKGLPPAPAYLPGTAITPPDQTPGKSGDPVAVPSVRSIDVKQRRLGDLDRQVAPDRSADEVWAKLTAYFPEPGHFAVIPASALRPFLVRNGEYDFCEQIKCHRSAGVLGAWNGGAFDEKRGEFRVHGGGHADYGGNEIYKFDFTTLAWVRETDPQPLTGPFQRDTNQDGTPDICPAPAVGPPATHTYQGFLYVPKIDRYWLLGTVGYCSNGMGGSAAWEYDAKSKSWTVMPDLTRFAKFTRAVIDPDSGNVLVHVGRQEGWFEIDPATRSVVRSFDKDDFGRYIDGPAVFDPQRRIIYALLGGRDADRLVAYKWPRLGESAAMTGRLVAEWPKAGRKGWGLAQHASGLLVLWDGAARIVVVDPVSGKSWEEDTAGFPQTTADAEQSGKVYSKFGYIAAVDTFFGIATADQGIVLYRLHEGAQNPSRPVGDDTGTGSVGTVSPDVRSSSSQPDLPEAKQIAAAASPAEESSRHDGPTPMEIEATAAWKDVCSTAILCDPIGAGDVLYRGQIVEDSPAGKGRGWRSIGQKFDHPEAQLASADLTVGGLRFAFPSNSGSGAAGNYKTDFSPDYSFQVGPAEAGAPAQEVYIQFQVRYSCTFIWTDCDPNSANYRKERRCFLSKRGEGHCTVSKIALVSTGDRKDWQADACTRIQIAINHDSDHSLHAFNRCPRAQGFGEKLARVNGKSQGNSQPNGAYYCPRILDGGVAKAWNNTADSCFRLIDDRWITIQVHLRYGPWQAKRSKDDRKLSHVSIWAAIEGESGGRQRLVIDNDFAPTTPEHPNDYIGKIWLMPHLFEKSDKEEHPPFFVWYRNLIVSETLIPNAGQ